MHPFAVDIFNRHEGRIFRAECVDHIIPHRGDMGLFWNVNNWQGLTIEDHNRKTAMEDGGLGRTTDSLTVVCGPPGSGKTTFVNQHRAEGDIVWDLDLIAQALTGLAMHQRTPGVVSYLIALRDAFYREALRPSAVKRIWIIDSSPTERERERFRRELHARVILLDTPEGICLDRVRSRGPEWEGKVKDWFAKSAEPHVSLNG